MQHVFEYTVDNAVLDNIHEIIKNNQTKFEPSDVYLAAENEKIIRPDLRVSEKRQYYDESLFTIAKQILNEINKKIVGKKFVIFKNDVTHIKYNEGGFFKSHEDYLSINSNLIEEYSMILCIKGDCEGGQTILKLNDFFSQRCEKTKTPGGCLLFRKDIPHEGALVEKDTKEILTFNVWCINNQDSQIIVINFIQDDRKYYLSRNSIINYPSDNIFKRFLLDVPCDDIILYTCTHTYEEFQIVMKIYQGSVISNEEYDKYVDIIKYYNFDITNIFIKSFKTNPVTKPNQYIDDHMILFGNEAQSIDFFNRVKKNKMQCIPFKIVFAEGTVAYGGNMSDVAPVNVKWRPVWASFSDYNHVMLIHNVCYKHIELTNNFYDVNEDMITAKKKYINIIGGYFEKYDYSKENRKKTKYITQDGECGFGGNCIVPGLLGYNRKIKNDEIIDIITNHYMPDISLKKPYHIKSEYCGSYYLTPNNKITLREQNIEKIMNKVKEIDIYERITKVVNSINIETNQNKMVDETYCNENIYGNFNLVMVYGGLFMNDV